MSDKEKLEELKIYRAYFNSLRVALKEYKKEELEEKELESKEVYKPYVKKLVKKPY